MIFVINKNNLEVRQIKEKDSIGFDSNWLINPDLSQVEGHPFWHWQVVNDQVVLKSSADMALADSQILDARAQAISNKIDDRSFQRAFARLVLNEINRLSVAINETRDAISTASSLAEAQTNIQALGSEPERTLAQLKNQLKNSVD